MNILNYILIVVIVAILLVWNSRRVYRNQLTPFGILWENYAGKGTADSATKLDDYIKKQIMEAQSTAGLKYIYPDILKFTSARPFNFWRERNHTRESPELEKCFNNKLHLLQVESEIFTKKCNDERAAEEAKRTKVVTEATTLDEIKEVFYGNISAFPSYELARQKSHLFSLKEILTATTLEQLETANKRARYDAPAKKFVPFMHEMISRDMVEKAQSMEAVIAAATLAPSNPPREGTALHEAFAKLYVMINAK